MKKTIACYVRVSTKDQNLVNQERELKKWLRDNGIELERVEWYRDQVSGKNLDRPAMDRLRRDVDEGRIKTVVVWKLDRVSRNLRDGVNVIFDWCDKGVRLVSMTEGIDFANTIGKIIASFLSGLAQMESEYRRERQVVGIETAKAKGVYKGRKPGTTKCDPMEALELRKKGMKVKQIAKVLDVSETAIFRYLNIAKAMSKQ